MQTMQKARDMGAERTGPQLVVAVFDDWDALHAVLVELKPDVMLRPAVLHARMDVPPAGSDFGLLKDLAHLHFSQPRLDITCTAGQLAQELHAQTAAGARSFEGALRGLFSSDLAEHLEYHIEKGRLVLCLQLRTPEDFSEVCARLVQTSPHMVELCNMRFAA